MTYIERSLFTLLIFVKWVNYSCQNKGIFSYYPGTSLLALVCRLLLAHGQVLMAVVSFGGTWWSMDCLIRRGLNISYFFSFTPWINFRKDLRGKKSSYKHTKFLIRLRERTKYADSLRWRLNIWKIILKNFSKSSFWVFRSQSIWLRAHLFFFVQPPIILINCIVKKKKISLHQNKYYFCSLKFLNSPWLQMCKDFRLLGHVYWM